MGAFFSHFDTPSSYYIDQNNRDPRQVHLVSFTMIYKTSFYVNIFLVTFLSFAFEVHLCTIRLEDRAKTLK